MRIKIETHDCDALLKIAMIFNALRLRRERAPSKIVSSISTSGGKNGPKAAV